MFDGRLEAALARIPLRIVKTPYSSMFFFTSLVFVSTQDPNNRTRFPKQSFAHTIDGNILTTNRTALRNVINTGYCLTSKASRANWMHRLVTSTLIRPPIAHRRTRSFSHEATGIPKDFARFGNSSKALDLAAVECVGVAIVDSTIRKRNDENCFSF